MEVVYNAKAKFASNMTALEFWQIKRKAALRHGLKVALSYDLEKQMLSYKLLMIKDNNSRYSILLMQLYILMHTMAIGYTIISLQAISNTTAQDIS